jgi:HD-GYP domain-containing protein (c-di-GMP phosphodiesterase class II)
LSHFEKLNPSGPLSQILFSADKLRQGGLLSAAKKTNLNLVWGDIPSWSYSAVASILESLKKVDPETLYHCLRVGNYSRLLAKAAGLTEYQQKVAEFAGILHDVGKIGISVDITHKPGKLTTEEYELMKDHPVYSEDIMKPLAIHEFFRQVQPAVRGHHERIDGKGYPDKLHGEDIPVLSRVILIVDTLDAMGEDRAYRKGMPIDLIYKELEKFAGTQFDQAMVKIFLESHKHWAKETPDQETFTQIIKKVA